MLHANKICSVQCPPLCRVIFLHFLAFFVDICLNFFLLCFRAFSFKGFLLHATLVVHFDWSHFRFSS